MMFVVVRLISAKVSIFAANAAATAGRSLAVLDE